MGIFDRGGAKKGTEKQAAGGAPAQAEDPDYFDSPQETVSLDSASKPAAPARAGAPAAAAAPRPVVSHDEDVRPAYGIENAIQLMRALPVDQNPELVVAVIKTTLESLKVKVSDIIADATAKQKDLEGRVANLKQQIADFEREIATRKGEIERFEKDHAETSAVKARLELAEKAQHTAKAAAK